MYITSATASSRNEYSNRFPMFCQEVYANFVGDMLFEKGNLTHDNLIDNLDVKSKPRFIQASLDIIDWLKQKLKGNKEITLELVRLETKYLRALNAAQKAWEQKQQTTEQQKTSTEGGGEYSFRRKGAENLHDTPTSLLPQSERERSAFNRSFANKTSDLKKGNHRDIIINTNEFQYLVNADGYMSGVVISKASIDNYNEGVEFYGSVERTEIPDFGNESKRDRSRDNRSYRNTSNDRQRDLFNVELDEFIRRHSEPTADSRKVTADYQRKRIKAWEELAKRYRETGKLQFSLPNNTLENRVSGDDLLNAQDLIEEIESVGGAVDENGYVTVYHRTTENSNVEKIIIKQKRRRLLRRFIVISVFEVALFGEVGIRHDLMLGQGTGHGGYFVHKIFRNPLALLVDRCGAVKGYRFADEHLFKPWGNIQRHKLQILAALFIIKLGNVDKAVLKIVNDIVAGRVMLGEDDDPCTVIQKLDRCFKGRNNA